MKEVTEDDYRKFITRNKSISLFGKTFELKKPEIRELEPKNFKLETTTVFSFPKRGEWATHYLNAAYRGNFTPEIARNVLLRYSRENEVVLDPFCGSGTTLVEAKLLKRKFMGVDINQAAALISWNRLDFDGANRGAIYVGDARNLDLIETESVDCILGHPPYANIIPYSKNSGDLSLLKPQKFCFEMANVAKELYRVLKPGGFCAVLIGDSRAHGDIIPISHTTMQKFIGTGFKLKEDIIKIQWNCKTTPYWEGQSKKYNFHLIMHEHLFIFRK